MKSIVGVILLVILTACEVTSVCPESEPYNQVTIDEDSDDDYIIVETSGCPPFDNPNWNNPGNAVEQDLSLKIPKTPKYAKIPIPVGEELEDFDGITYLKEDPKPIFGSIGVLQNGVVVFGVGSPCGFGSNCPSEGTGAPSIYVDAFESEGSTFDQCGGHPQMQGQYHIHSGASFMNNAGRKMCNLSNDTAGEHSVLLGWMFDGFPMYGQYSQGGELPTQLDECHGHTHDIDGVMTYHYHMPTGFPYIIGCFKGCPESTNNGMELNKYNGDSTYGCPVGLANDPDPVYELQTNPTVSSTISNPTVSSTTANPTVSSTTSTSLQANPTVSPSPTSTPDSATGVFASTSVALITLIISILV